MKLVFEVKRPSALDAAELAAWRAIMAGQPALCRAFLTPAFAIACERAHGRAFVAVLRREGAPVGFFPFQFQGPWQQRVGLAERIGGDLSDNAGLIAVPGLRITPAALLRGAGLGALFMTHLVEGQAEFGLEVEETRLGHMIDLADGPATFLAYLERTNKAFVQDTRRQIRRIEREIGPLEFVFSTAPAPAEVAALIEEKRAQYRRTGTGDPFINPVYQRLVNTLVEVPDPDCQPVLETLSAGGRVLSRHFGVMYAGHLTYWFPVYDPELRQLSPGRLQLWHTILTATENGVRLIDLGEGDSQAKRDFSTRAMPLGWANWSSSGLRSLPARTFQRIAWRLGR